MPLDSTTIDRIVAGVLTQLGGTAVRANGGNVTTDARRHGEASSVERRALSALPVGGRIITAETLESLPDSAQEIVVDLKAIVTPAAWDVAKLRGLRVDRGTPVPATPSPGFALPIDNRQSSIVNLLVVVHHTDAIARLWDDLQTKWRREFLGCPDDAAKLAIAELARGGALQVVIVAEQTHRAACLANRHESVKAVAIRDIADVQATKTQLRANVWCVSPKDKSWFELRRLFSSLDPRP